MAVLELPLRHLPSPDLVVLDLGAGVEASELLVGHVREGVELELIRLVLLVEFVDELDVVLEHVEPPVLLVEVPCHRVVAAPSLVERPQAVLGGQILLGEGNASRHREGHCEKHGHQQHLPPHLN